MLDQNCMCLPGKEHAVEAPEVTSSPGASSDGAKSEHEGIDGSPADSVDDAGKSWLVPSLLVIQLTACSQVLLRTKGPDHFSFSLVICRSAERAPLPISCLSNICS